MLNKLLKYEFKDTARIIPLLYLIALVFAGISISASQLGIGWFRETSSLLLLLLGIAVVIITFVVVVMRFYKNLYSNEGYLMFTLPVKPQSLLVSKTITALCWVILSYIIFSGAFCISMYGFGVGLDAVSDIMAELKIMGLQNAIYLLIPMVLLSTICLIVQIFFAITMSNLSAFSNLGAGAAFLIFIITNIAMQTIEAVFAIFVPFSVEINYLGNTGIVVSSKNMFGFILESINSTPDSIVIGLGGYIFDAVAVCVLFYITGRMMKNRVSIK